MIVSRASTLSRRRLANTLSAASPGLRGTLRGARAFDAAVLALLHEGGAKAAGAVGVAGACRAERRAHASAGAAGRAAGAPSSGARRRAAGARRRPAAAALTAAGASAGRRCAPPRAAAASRAPAAPIAAACGDDSNPHDRRHPAHSTLFFVWTRAIVRGSPGARRWHSVVEESAERGSGGDADRCCLPAVIGR